MFKKIIKQFIKEKVKIKLKLNHYFPTKLIQVMIKFMHGGCNKQVKTDRVKSSEVNACGLLFVDNTNLVL